MDVICQFNSSLRISFDDKRVGIGNMYPSQSPRPLSHQGDESNAENHRNTFSIKS
jgi:hypothetical protein